MTLQECLAETWGGGGGGALRPNETKYRQVIPAPICEDWRGTNRRYVLPRLLLGRSFHFVQPLSNLVLVIQVPPKPMYFTQAVGHQKIVSYFNPNTWHRYQDAGTAHFTRPACDCIYEPLVCNGRVHQQRCCLPALLPTSAFSLLNFLTTVSRQAAVVQFLTPIERDFFSRLPLVAGIRLPWNRR